MAPSSRPTRSSITPEVHGMSNRPRTAFSLSKLGSARFLGITGVGGEVRQGLQGIGEIALIAEQVLEGGAAIEDLGDDLVQVDEGGIPGKILRLLEHEFQLAFPIEGVADIGGEQDVNEVFALGIADRTPDPLDKRLQTLAREDQLELIDVLGLLGLFGDSPDHAVKVFAPLVQLLVCPFGLNSSSAVNGLVDQLLVALPNPFV